MKNYLRIHSITLLLLIIVLLSSSACSNANQSSGGSQAGAKNTPSTNDDLSGGSTLPTPIASNITPTSQATQAGITPTATVAGKIIPTPTVKTAGGPLPTPTSKTAGITPPAPTPTPQVIPTLPPTPTPAASNTVYHQVGTMTIPNGSKSSWNFDISWVDQASERYYLADRDRKGIDIFDLKTQTFVQTITGFAGPNGVLVDSQGQLWVGDADSTVKIVNLASNTISATISTGGTDVTDEISYDPQDQIILAANGDDSAPFVTLISATNHTVLKKVKIAATDGLEQSVWDSQTHLFYISVPKTAKNPGGEIDIIDPQQGVVSSVVALSACNPAGFAIGPNHQAIIGCDGHPVILDLTSWTVLATITQANGCDEVWYNSGDQRYYLAADGNNAGPVLSVINAQTLAWIQNVSTKGGSHSVAVDATTNTAFIPTVGVGIALYSL